MRVCCTPRSQRSPRRARQRGGAGCWTRPERRRAARNAMLKRDVEDIRDAIKVGRFTNEAAVCQGIFLRLLHALSWPTYDTQIVFPEYSVEGRREDFAPCHPARKPLALIEVRHIGQSDRPAERHLFEYPFHQGTPTALL